jgi:hypothetical protein
MWAWGGTFPGSIFVVSFGTLGLAIWSAHRRGEHLTDIGLRIDNIRPALLLAAQATVPVIIVIFAAGFTWGRIRPDWLVVVGRLPWLVCWGFLQQFVLQGFVHRRLADLIEVRRDRELMTGLIFALFHLPNPRLMIATFVAGWVWAWVFRRRPNLLALAISHAVGSAAVSIAFGQDLMKGMRVGRAALFYEHRTPPLP